MEQVIAIVTTHSVCCFKLGQKCVKGKVVNILMDSLKARKRRVVLNGIYSQRIYVKARIPQGSVQFLASNPRRFADENSLFCVVKEYNLLAINLNNVLNKTSNWAFQWRMNFNTKLSKFFSPGSFISQLILPCFSIVAQWIEEWLKHT